MITFFSVPKAFKGHIGVIQTNAIESWLQLKPVPEIILLGDDEGIAEVAQKYDLRHIPDLKYHAEWKAPLLDDIIESARKESTFDNLCFIHTDIILFQDFLKAFRLVSGRFEKYLMVSSRFNMNIESRIELDSEEKRQNLRASALNVNDMYTSGGTDFFAFPKSLYKKIPPFLLGRGYWDNWMMYQALHEKAALIDTTTDVVALHQNHDYAHVQGVASGERDGDRVFKARQGYYNLSLAGGQKNVYNNYDANYVLKNGIFHSTWRLSFLKRHLKSTIRRIKLRIKGK
ncbi:MAG: hypothetical protein K2W94_00170 [Alphaproteobacteria bacterium]|nr:hypothetical protein [Alphaproteobacteria bacterium]